MATSFLKRLPARSALDLFASENARATGFEMYQNAIDNLNKPLNQYQKQELDNSNRQSSANTGAAKAAIIKGEKPTLTGPYDSNAITDMQYQYDKDQQALAFKKAAEARAASNHARTLAKVQEEKAYKNMLLEGINPDRPLAEEVSVADGQQVMLDNFLPKGPASNLDVSNFGTYGNIDVAPAYPQGVIGTGSNQETLNFPMSAERVPDLIGKYGLDSTKEVMKSMSKPITGPMSTEGFTQYEPGRLDPATLNQVAEDNAGSKALENLKTAMTPKVKADSPGIKVIKDASSKDKAETYKLAKENPALSGRILDAYLAREQARTLEINGDAPLNEFEKATLKNQTKVNLEKDLKKNKLGSYYDSKGNRYKGKVAKGNRLDVANKIMSAAGFNAEDGGNIDTDNEIRIRKALVDAMAEDYTVEEISTAMSKGTKGGGFFSHVSGLDEMQFELAPFRAMLAAQRKAAGNVK